MSQELYWGLENLNLNEAQKDVLIAELRTLGSLTCTNPEQRNHWATREDNDAAIFQAAWNPDNITIPVFKTKLAALFPGVDPGDISHTVQEVTFVTLASDAVTFTYNAVDYIRVVFFGFAGGVFPTLEESLTEVRQYIEDNKELWNPDV